jgi:hypothetical protein
MSMESIIFARQFKLPVDAAAIEAGMAANGWCLDLHRVQHRWSYLAQDGTRMICLFHAPDAEAVRNALREVPPRPDYVHTVSLHAPDSGDTSMPLAASSEALVVVERSFEAPVSLEEIQAMEGKGQWCLDTHQVRIARSYLSRDGKRLVCVYHAPDAEAVRSAQRSTGLPFDKLWTARIYMKPQASQQPEV